MIGFLLWVVVYLVVAHLGARYFFGEEDGPYWLRYAYCAFTGFGAWWGGWKFAAGVVVGVVFTVLQRQLRPSRP